MSFLTTVHPFRALGLFSLSILLVGSFVGCAVSPKPPPVSRNVTVGRSSADERI